MLFPLIRDFHIEIFENANCQIKKNFPQFGQIIDRKNIHHCCQHVFVSVKLNKFNVFKTRREKRGFTRTHH